MENQGQTKRKTGALYEQRAAEYLEKKGYRILQRNYRCRAGEIDLVARDGVYLVFLEVKYRRDNKAGLGEEAVNAAKQSRIIRAARRYLYEQRLPQDQPCRFDVLSFLGEQVTLIQDAFQC